MLSGVTIGLGGNEGANAAVFDDEERKTLTKGMLDLDKDLKACDLSYSSMTANRIINLLSDTSASFAAFSQQVQRLIERVKDEMNSRSYFYVEPDKQQSATGINLFGEQVAITFQSAMVDIEEAGKCLAFGRGTACVFRLMRVMETGLAVLGESLDNPALVATTNRSWETILKKCDEELRKPLKQRSPEWASDDAFFADATARLRAVKDAWRNPTMHVEATYTIEQATDIWNHVGSFMRLLSSKV